MDKVGSCFNKTKCSCKCYAIILILYQEIRRNISIVHTKTLGFLIALAKGNEHVQSKIYSHLDDLLKLKVGASELARALKEVGIFIL